MTDREKIYLDDICPGVCNCFSACSIHNKNEITFFILNHKKYCEIVYSEINESNIYYKGYEFFKDFQGIIRYDKIEPINNRWEILDIR